jgi:hypothetical protein
MWKRYGYPNHLLVLLNIHNFRVRDVPVRPVYNIGEKSNIRIWRVIPGQYGCTNKALFVMFLMLFGLNFLLFGLWFDMDYNRDLK